MNYFYIVNNHLNLNISNMYCFKQKIHSDKKYMLMDLNKMNNLR